jgi:hypothetical protein
MVGIGHAPMRSPEEARDIHRKAVAALRASEGDPL